MTEKEKKKDGEQIAFRIEESLKRKFDSKIALEGRTQKDTLAVLIAAYVESSIAPKGHVVPIEIPPVSAAELPPDHRKYMNMLLAVLNSGNEIAESAVKQNLTVFLEFVQIKAHARHKQKRESSRSQKAAR